MHWFAAHVYESAWHFSFGSLLPWSRTQLSTFQMCLPNVEPCQSTNNPLFPVEHQWWSSTEVSGGNCKDASHAPPFTQRAPSHHAQNPWILIVLIVCGQLASLPLWPSHNLHPYSLMSFSFACLPFANTLYQNGQRVGAVFLWFFPLQSFHTTAVLSKLWSQLSDLQISTFDK